MKWKPMTMPKEIVNDQASATDNYSRFIIEPLERGYGITLGAALRRVLLSSIQGAAVVTVTRSTFVSTSEPPGPVAVSVTV